MNISCKKIVTLRKKVALLTTFLTLYSSIFFIAFAQAEIPPPTLETSLSANFLDVEPGEDHYVAINYLKEQGLIEGYEDGTFKPDSEINRAEALKILMSAIKNEKNTTTDETTKDIKKFSFPDVSPTNWYYAGIKEAYDKNLVRGYPDGYFHPEQTINRAESLKIVLLREGQTIPSTVTEPPYTDVPIDSWFAPYAVISFERTLFIESRGDGNLFPSQNMTRGEFAGLIYRLIKSTDGTRFTRSTWYGVEGTEWGTASGEAFDANLLTAAHKTLPFGTILKVTNSNNGKSVNVKINDRGPYSKGVHLDLSRAAFEEIASLGAGIIFTEYKVIESPIVDDLDNNNVTTDEIPNSLNYGF